MSAHRKHSETQGLDVLQRFVEDGTLPPEANGEVSERIRLLKRIEYLEHRLRTVETLLNVVPEQPVADA